MASASGQVIPGLPTPSPGLRHLLYEAEHMSAVLQAVTLNEIEKIFTVLERLGISREAVVIPLRPATGKVRRLPNGKFEIVVPAEVPIDDWLGELERQLSQLE